MGRNASREGTKKTEDRWKRNHAVHVFVFDFRSFRTMRNELLQFIRILVYTRPFSFNGVKCLFREGTRKTENRWIRRPALFVFYP